MFIYGCIWLHWVLVGACGVIPTRERNQPLLPPSPLPCHCKCGVPATRLQGKSRVHFSKATLYWQWMGRKYPPSFDLQGMIIICWPWLSVLFWELCCVYMSSSQWASKRATFLSPTHRWGSEKQNDLNTVTQPIDRRNISLSAQSPRCYQQLFFPVKEFVILISDQFDDLLSWKPRIE